MNIPCIEQSLNELMYKCSQSSAWFGVIIGYNNYVRKYNNILVVYNNHLQSPWLGEPCINAIFIIIVKLNIIQP